MSGEPTDTEKAVELIHIASMAVQINKLAVENQPTPAYEAGALAREIADGALKRAKALLDKDEQA
jgi:hypothetical protein